MKLFKSYSKKSDEQLMLLIQGRDHRAFSEIYDRYAGRMKGFFYRMLWSDDSLADDCVHDLFTRIIERPLLYKENHAFAPWLFQIASNMCKNAYRKRSFEVEYRSQLEQNGIQMPTIDQQIDEKILLDHLYQVLDQLDEEKRDLFLLRYQQQLSIKELTEIFDTSEGTIKSRLYYIRKCIVGTMDKNTIKREDE